MLALDSTVAARAQKSVIWRVLVRLVVGCARTELAARSRVAIANFIVVVISWKSVDMLLGL